MAAVDQEAVERKKAITSESKLNIEKSAREAEDAATSISYEVARLDEADANLSSMIDEQGVITSNINQDLTARINGLGQSTSSAIGSLNNAVGDISMNRIPGLSMDIANEMARAQQIENDLQQQITSLLATPTRRL